MRSPATRPLRAGAVSRRRSTLGERRRARPAALRGEPRDAHLGVDVAVVGREGGIARQDELARVPKPPRKGRASRRPADHGHGPRAAAADVAADRGHDLPGRSAGRPRARRERGRIRILVEHRGERDAPQRRVERRRSVAQRFRAVAQPASSEGLPVFCHY